MDMLVGADEITHPRAVHIRVLAQGHGTCLYDQVVEGNLHRRKLVDMLAGLDRIVHSDGHAEVEMRRAELAFRQALGDDLTHLAQRLIAMAFLADGGKLLHLPFLAFFCCRLLSCLLLLRLEIVHIALDDAAIVAATLHLRYIYPFILRQFLSQRGGFYTLIAA